MLQRLLDRHGAPAPRYTSYPTAPHFHAGINAETYATWLAALPAGATASLYLHVPYCDRLCWFCACHTRQTLRYAPVTRYVDALCTEIGTVGEMVRGRVEVTALHFGGGSPTILEPVDLKHLDKTLRGSFDLRPDAEISVEIDPNDMDDERFDALASIGMTRASLGVQDFDPQVQKAINRDQSFEVTRHAVRSVRGRGAASVNLDVLYGLPHQTEDSLSATVAQVLSLEPDRIALFGYAHVPWFKKHQQMIDEAALPGPRARLDMAMLAAKMIREAGYVTIGLDHFARPADSMAVSLAQGNLGRNFQGYTVDAADALIGLGASSIGRLPQGYVQNVPATGEYERLVGAGRLAAVRGIELTPEDRIRGWVIERLMCDFGFSRSELARRFGGDAGPILAEAENYAATDQDGLFARRADRYEVTQTGRPFVRALAARFDAYLAKGAARHSAAV
ncbi:MAG: oxygen-independent coproporphyrinogen III oxidase [Rhizobiaceae bacterium]|nr:oxygen-independent coproporphyrinogen III oxidase [Rhizobiaceae bacterium]